MTESEQRAEIMRCERECRARWMQTIQEKDRQFQRAMLALFAVAALAGAGRLVKAWATDNTGARMP